MDTSSSDDEQTRARFASVAVESDSIRAQATAVPSKPSRDSAVDVDAFVAKPFQLKVAQMLEQKLDRWYEAVQLPACHRTSSKDGWDGSTWSSDTGVRLFSKVKPGTAFTTPSHSNEAPSSEDVRILAASPRREVEEQAGHGRRKPVADRSSDSSSSEDEEDVGFHELLRSVAVDSDYVRSTAEKSAKKAHQTYREEQDRTARTDALESSRSRPSLHQVTSAVARTPTRVAGHDVDGTASVSNGAQVGQRRNQDCRDAPKTNPSRHKDTKRVRRR
mmetsp:Transcript_5669/g.35243  ORF Transcript_5669/g.35243 Transcript_5669/m.35243 type:complete len:275 (-) Transcript_5669:651-1475(-)